MPQDDLKEKVTRLDGEMSDRTTETVNLERRVGDLEKDVRTLVFLCHYIRGFADRHVSPVADENYEKFNITFSALMRRYEVPSP